MIQSTPVTGNQAVNWRAPRLGNEGADGKPGFSDLLKETIAQASELERQAQALDARLALGESVELHDVVLAAEKARLSLDLVVQVRNKAIEAYQEIMRMQV